MLNELKIHQRNWHVIPSGMNQFEVRNAGEAFEVDLERKTCSCRLWQLNGYGCVHSIACICFLDRDVEVYVNKMFSSTTYMAAYSHNIAGMNGVAMWPETSYTPPLPPINRRMPGRPCVKRKRDSTESSGTRVSKAGKKVKCSICKEPGHNKSSCQKHQKQKMEQEKKEKRLKPQKAVKLDVKRRDASQT